MPIRPGEVARVLCLYAGKKKEERAVKGHKGVNLLFFQSEGMEEENNGNLSTSTPMLSVCSCSSFPFLNSPVFLSFFFCCKEAPN